MVDVADALRKLGRPLTVGAAQFSKFRIRLEVFGRSMDARHGINHLMDTGKGEVNHCGFGDINAGTAEACLRFGQRETLDELVGDLIAHLVAITADTRAECSNDVRRIGPLELHQFHSGFDDAAFKATPSAMSRADDAGDRVGEEHRQAVSREHTQGDAGL